jgi:hypothetical protein
MTSKVPRDLAFYYPNPFWYDGNWIKNLVLYFDGVAVLVPRYMSEKLETNDPAIVIGLREHNLIQVIEPETAIDKPATERLASAMTEIIVSGSLDKLATDGTAFHELSMSRLGWDGDAGLARMIFDELKNRNLARDSADGVSVPMHPKVRHLVLVLLAQILRARSMGGDAELSPVTDMTTVVEALAEFLSARQPTSTGGVVSFDMNVVGVDVSSIPLDEVLDFRRQNLSALQMYRRDVRVFAAEVSALPSDARDAAFEKRQDELDARAADLKRLSTKAWRKPAAFAMSLTGAAWTALTGNPIGALLSAAGATLGYSPQSSPELGAYSYLFRAAGRYG